MLRRAAGAWILAAGFADAFVPHPATLVIQLHARGAPCQVHDTSRMDSSDEIGPVDATWKLRSNDVHVDMDGHYPSTPMPDQVLTRADAMSLGSTFAVSSPLARPDEGDAHGWASGRSDLHRRWKPPVGYVPQRYRHATPEQESDLWSAQDEREQERGGVEPTIGERLVLLKLILSKIANHPSKDPHDL